MEGKEYEDIGSKVLQSKHKNEDLKEDELEKFRNLNNNQHITELDACKSLCDYNDGNSHHNFDKGPLFLVRTTLSRLNQKEYRLWE